MTTSIRSEPALLNCYNHPQTPRTPTDYKSLQQMSAETKKADVTILTGEGDVVILSAVKAQVESMSTEIRDSCQTGDQNIALAGLFFDRVAVSVQGDLNQEELSDIKRLMDDLNSIADDFFSGRMDEALEGALNLGDMGSLSRLSATLSRTSTASYRLSGHHLTSAGAIPEATQGFNDLKEAIENSDAIKYAELLRAQWEQINEFLDKPGEETPEQNEASPVKKGKDPEPAQHMMEKFRDTVIRHPRVSPFILPLGRKAINESMARANRADARNAGNILWTNFLKAYDEWLIQA